MRPTIKSRNQFGKYHCEEFKNWKCEYGLYTHTHIHTQSFVLHRNGYWTYSDIHLSLSWWCFDVFLLVVSVSSVEPLIWTMLSCWNEPCEASTTGPKWNSFERIVAYHQPLHQIENSCTRLSCMFVYAPVEMCRRERVCRKSFHWTKISL